MILPGFQFRFPLRLRRIQSGIVSFFLWALLGVMLALAGLQPFLLPVSAQESPSVTEVQLGAQGRSLYQAGQFAEAVQLWQQLAQTHAVAGNRFEQAQALSNLALAYQQLGQWQEAMTAINQSLSLLKSGEDSPKRHQSLAQVLNTQGGVQFALGQGESALSSWQQATDHYRQAGDQIGALQSQINQAQVLRSLGLYRRALATSTQVQQQLQDFPDSLLKAVGLRSLGQTLQLLGDFDAAQEALQHSLDLASVLNAPSDLAAAQFALANTLRSAQKIDAALALYRQVLTTAADPIMQVQVQLNQLSLLIEIQNWPAAEQLWPQIPPQLAGMPAGFAQVSAQLNLGEHLTHLKRSYPQAKVNWSIVSQLIAQGITQARYLGQPQAESYGLGLLGAIYEQTQQWEDAQTLTEQALGLAQAHHAPEIAYRWQWQLGRLQVAQTERSGGGDYREAIAAYSEAVGTLQSLRSELTAISTEVQFSFRASVEPIYRELVSLLLKPSPGEEVSQANLEQAREVIEALQLAELDNFFREACLDVKPVAIDEIDPQAAVVYPIVLADRLEVIVRIPQHPLHHYTSFVSKAELDHTARMLRQTLVIRSKRQFRPIARQLYDWLIRPIDSDLRQSHIKTLVFVLDGSLRNLPVAALLDGNQYLIEQFSIALTPGLQLLDPQPLRVKRLHTLATGLTQYQPGFSPLRHVNSELNAIQTQVPSKVLLNQQFTQENLERYLDQNSYPIVHIATHGQFSSNQTETFLLAWNSRIGVDQLRTLLQNRQPNQPQSIELLVLSACKTATGDQQATLGLAGLAVRAGARSTIATLWSVDDQATSELMRRLYQELAQHQTTKSEALRQAQLSLLRDPANRHPFYWAPYVLVGNWL
jgi:CHAT domain-containing protein/Flp pilus assembly protein TadD